MLLVTCSTDVLVTQYFLNFCCCDTLMVNSWISDSGDNEAILLYVILSLCPHKEESVRAENYI